MVCEKLQTTLKRILCNMQVAPVIVRVKPGFLEEVFYEIRQVDLSQFVARRYFNVTVMPFGLIPGHMFKRFNMFNALLPRDIIYRLSEDRRVEKVYYDAPMYALSLVVPEDGVYTWARKAFTTTYWTKKLIGADKANAKGFTGKGIKVAVPDTGVALHHEQLGFRLGAKVSFRTTMPLQRLDENGHGTWCVTCIAGRRVLDSAKTSSIGKDVLTEGMAPDVNVLAIKCLGYVIGTGATSQVMRAMEIALDWGADVVSMSLGGTEDAKKPEEDPYYHVLEEYLKSNIIPVIAAGNEGPKEGTISSPGALPQALTVGAWDPIEGRLANFSSRGPTPWGDTKPDVVAPGVNIDSGTVGYLDMVDGAEDRFAILSGTSMATPHVAGLVALMREAHKKLLGKVLTVQEVKDMMAKWADEHGIIKNNETGWGLITWDIYEWWLETQYGVKI